MPLPRMFDQLDLCLLDIQIYCQPSDLSIAFGVRAWLHAMFAIEFGVLTHLLELSRHLAGSDNLRKQFSSILKATGGSATAFYSKFAFYLPTIRHDFKSTGDAILFVLREHRAAHKNTIFHKDGGGEPHMHEETYFGDFVDACLNHSNLLDSIFHCVIEESRLSRSTHQVTDSYEVLGCTMTTLSSFLSQSMDHYPSKSVRLVKHWAHHGLLESPETALNSRSRGLDASNSCMLYSSYLLTPRKRSYTLLQQGYLGFYVD